MDTIAMSDLDEGLGPVRPVPRRRRWSEADKRRIVAESYQPGTPVAVVARRNDVHASLLFAWRRRYCNRTGRLKTAEGMVNTTAPRAARRRSVRRSGRI